MRSFIYIIIGWLLIQCKSPKPTEYADFLVGQSVDLLEQPEIKAKITHDTAFVNYADFAKDFDLNIKYATADNFLKTKVYDCPECYLRFKAVKRLQAAQKDFQRLGFRVQLLDCYRPHLVQIKMWEIYPNAKYVADPSKGSMHNRGIAVDLTLLDKNGVPLDMGTAFDHFGEESAHAYTNLSETVLKNRTTLKSIMEKHGFQSLASEWWHYQLPVTAADNIANFTWDCTP